MLFIRALYKGSTLFKFRVILNAFFSPKKIIFVYRCCHLFTPLCYLNPLCPERRDPLFITNNVRKHNRWPLVIFLKKAIENKIKKCCLVRMCSPICHVRKPGQTVHRRLIRDRKRQKYNQLIRDRKQRQQRTNQYIKENYTKSLIFLCKSFQS